MSRFKYARWCRSAATRGTAAPRDHVMNFFPPPSNPTLLAAVFEQRAEEELDAGIVRRGEEGIQLIAVP